jgi:hypothetical protein
MKQIVMSAMCAMIVLMACNKKEPQAVEETVSAAKQAMLSECGKEMIAEKPVKVGETGIMLPVGSKFCITTDNLEVRVELPSGFAFLAKDETAAERTLPVFATYACYCSGQGSACNVFYADGLGFGCLQSSCTGSCTGKFTYKGYSVDRVVPTSSKEDFFAVPEVQAAIAKISSDEAYSKQSVYGVPFYLVNNEKLFLSKASCDCEGTQACKLKKLTLSLSKGAVASKEIYFCDGPCNGCELTVN